MRLHQRIAIASIGALVKKLPSIPTYMLVHMYGSIFTFMVYDYAGCNKGWILNNKKFKADFTTISALLFPFYYFTSFPLRKCNGRQNKRSFTGRLVHHYIIYLCKYGIFMYMCVHIFPYSTSANCNTCSSYFNWIIIPNEVKYKYIFIEEYNNNTKKQIFLGYQFKLKLITAIKPFDRVQTRNPILWLQFLRKALTLV